MAPNRGHIVLRKSATEKEMPLSVDFCDQSLRVFVPDQALDWRIDAA